MVVWHLKGWFNGLCVIRAYRVCGIALMIRQNPFKMLFTRANLLMYSIAMQQIEKCSFLLIDILLYAMNFAIRFVNQK